MKLHLPKELMIAVLTALVIYSTQAADYEISAPTQSVKMSTIIADGGTKESSIQMSAGEFIIDEDAANLQSSGGIIRLQNNASVSGTITGDTSVVVEGSSSSKIDGSNSYTGETKIKGSKNRLTVLNDNALGESDVILASSGQLLLQGHSVTNDIIVEPSTNVCYLKNATNYNGNVYLNNGVLGISNEDEYAGKGTTINKLTMSGVYGYLQGASTRADVTVNTLEVLSNSSGCIGMPTVIPGRVDFSVHLHTNQNGLIILHNKRLNVAGSLTLGAGTTIVLLGESFIKGAPIATVSDELINDGVQVKLANGFGSAIVQDRQLILAQIFDNSIAEALTVTNWGIATASRTFVNAVRGQRTNTGCIADGRGTAWAAVLGATSDIGSGDVDLKGAAVGADMKVGEKSSLGVAFGYIDGDAQIPGMSKAEQEGTYVALYGEHGLKKLSATSCLSLDWVAAYGQTDTEWESADWEQDSLQLNTRLNWNKKVTDRLCMSVFGGLEYFTSESDRVENAKTGSIQNLRGEIGVGARYVAWGTPGSQPVLDEKGATIAAARPGCEKLVLHGEIRYMNDLVRSNPVIEQDGIRDGGSDNPGRQGMGIEAGATYRISERWSASANYGFNTMEDSREHRVNVGASYTF